MSDPTAYHRKLAEAMDTAIDKAFVEHDFVDVIATVLAAEQVVDPEDHRDVVGELQAEQEAHRYVLDVRDELEQQLAALRKQNKARDELAAQCGEERDFWEQCIKDAAKRAGVDVAGTLGNASLHLIVEQLAALRSENERLKSKIAEFIDGENNA